MLELIASTERLRRQRGFASFAEDQQINPLITDAPSTKKLRVYATWLTAFASQAVDERAQASESPEPKLRSVSAVVQVLRRRSRY